jgi:3-dehydroquinate synthetase
LNLGHTAGHAIELASGFHLRHGEAIAIGMVAEARLAERLGLAETGLPQQISAALQGLGLPTDIPSNIDREDILRAMGVDKKRAGGKVRFSLPLSVGKVATGVEAEDFSALF